MYGVSVQAVAARRYRNATCMTAWPDPDRSSLQPERCAA